MFKKILNFFKKPKSPADIIIEKYGKDFFSQLKVIGFEPVYDPENNICNYYLAQGWGMDHMLNPSALKLIYKNNKNIYNGKYLVKSTKIEEHDVNCLNDYSKFLDGFLHNEDGPAYLSAFGQSCRYYLFGKSYLNIEDYLSDLHKLRPEKNVFFNLDKYHNCYKEYIEALQETIKNGN